MACLWHLDSSSGFSTPSVVMMSAHQLPGKSEGFIDSSESSVILETQYNHLSSKQGVILVEFGGNVVQRP